MAMTVAERLEQRLVALSRQHLGDDAGIEGLVKLSAGASRETWAFDAVLPDGRRLPLILKRDPPAEDGTSAAGVNARLGVDRATECRVIQRVGEAGVAAPGVRFELEAGFGGGEGFVMDRISGEYLGRRIVVDQALAPVRPRLARQLGEILAKMQAIPAETLPPLKSLSTAAHLALFRDILTSFGHPHPGFEYAIAWLEERLEIAGEGLALVHGDFRNGNFVVGPEGIRAVLDWELTHLGPPLLDLGWLCIRSWRYGRLDKPVGGFGELEDLLQGYQAGGGAEVDAPTFRYWEAFGCLRWGIICLVMSFTHLNREQRSIELAAIGRRAAETEYDLLELLD